MVLKFVSVLKILYFNTMFKFLCSYVNFMRLRPLEKSVRCLPNFERKKLPEISMCFNEIGFRSWYTFLTVLIRLDQHFIERGPYCSERERTLEIMDWGRIVRGLISPTWLESINNSPGPCYQPSLLQTGCRARASRTGVDQAATFHLFDPESQRGKECLRGSQTICSL
jgi:hypothetical protein